MPDFHESETDDRVFPELFTPEARAKREAEQEQKLIDMYGDEYELARNYREPTMPYTDKELEHLGKLCPECDSTDTESNGGTEYRCIRCDHRWGREYGEAYGYEPPNGWENE